MPRCMQDVSWHAQSDTMPPPDVPMQIAIVLEYINGGSLGDILQKVRLAEACQ